MNRKIINIAGVVLALALTGCATNADLEKSNSDLTSKINSLSNKIDDLSNQHSSLKSEHAALAASAQEAKDMAAAASAEAMKANERIDNVVSSYKK